MKFKIYHQLGHNHVWNIQSLQQDNVGDGLILAPRFMNRDSIERLDEKLKKVSVFDPQFFLPDIDRGQLSTYDFFPNATMPNGFNTNDYEEEGALKSAEKCVQFQLANEFQYIVIPTRYLSGMPTNYVRMQQDLFVSPFLDVIARYQIDRKIILQLVVMDDMIIDKEYSADLLNWITGIKELSGVYLITEVHARGKQIEDPEFLYHYLHFIQALSWNDLDVFLGYQNTEAVLTTLASPAVVTLGSYENLRMFGIKTFENQEKRPIRGPVPRVYSTKLYQWIDHRYIGAIMRALPNADQVFEDNQYKALMFEPTYQWYFSKPELYKHYFLVFSNQLKKLGNLSPRDRYLVLVDSLEGALATFRDLENRGVILSPESGGSHLPAWITSANQFAQDQGWR